MKRSAFKFISVIAAFFIGVSINNSCGESPIDNDLSSMYNSIRTLQNEVSNLKQEIKRLDSELAALRSSGGSSQGGDSSNKYVDGLYFSHGYPTGLVKHYKLRATSVSDKNEYISEMEYASEYTFDKYGRIIKQIEQNISPNKSRYESSYEYVGKTVIMTRIGTDSNYISQTTTEYY